MDRKAFFDDVRKAFGLLTQNQVTGLSLLLDAAKDLPMRHQAYVLATAWHETGPEDSPLHMTPRVEIWGPTAAQKRYEGSKALGNTLPGDGFRFMGRGFVQVTGHANYAKAAKVTGVDLVAFPARANRSDIAAKVMVSGMTEGWFTGKKMADYTGFRNMRRVVNGTDKAALIARYAEAFLGALLAGAVAASVDPLPDVPLPDVAAPPVAEPPQPHPPPPDVEPPPLPESPPAATAGPAIGLSPAASFFVVLLLLAAAAGAIYFTGSMEMKP